MTNNLDHFTDFLDDEIYNSQPLSLPSSSTTNPGSQDVINIANISNTIRPMKHTGERGGLRCVQEIDPKYRGVFSYQYFNLVQSRVIEDALYSDKSLVVCAPTGSGKTVIFEMAIVQLLMEMDDKQCGEDFKIIYMAPIKALCTERLTEWYAKFTKLNLLCIEVTGDTDVDFSQLKPYRIIITTPEKWDMLTRRWRDNRGMVEVIKLFLIDEVHILNDSVRGPVLEAVVSRMKTIQSSVQSTHRIEMLQRQGSSCSERETAVPKIRFVAVSATISNPEDVAEWLGTSNKPAVYHKFGDECRPVRLRRVVEGYPCPEGTSLFKFDIILNYKLWPIIQKYHNGKPTLIFCNTRKSVLLTAETLSREITINFSPEQRAKLVSLASIIKNKKVQSLVLCGVGCHHAGLLFEERNNIERAFRNSDLPILITTTTLAMGVNLPAHLVIIKNTQQYVNGAYQEYSISTVLQMVGRAGRPQFDTEATAVIMTRFTDKARYQALVGGCEPLQSYLHKRLAENLNSEAALGTVNDVAQCVQWLRSTFLFVRAARDPRKYLGLPLTAPSHHISKKVEELCVKAMNGLASSGLITMDEASCIQSTEAGRLMSIYYLDLETMKHIMKINGNESLEQLLWIVCESHELSDMHLRVDERRCLNALNRSNNTATIRFPMKGKINTRQMKLNCIIQAVLGCLPIHEPSLNQEAMKVMRIADRICKCLVAYVTRQNVLRESPQYYQAVLNSVVLAKCIESHLWENSIYVSKQLKGIGPTFSTLLATAGKINFMLLEESHPRDLERIMNKGPPAGNILRKQITFLPKYQLTIIPVDQSSVKIQLTLLNQTHLAENMEHLTAGANHKCYIIIGDTENYLLLLISFKDKDLISVYDGQITYEIIRRHNYEHKIIAHCISSNFAGIDVQCDYLFNDLETLYTKGTKVISLEDTTAKTTHVKHTEITDTFNLRKRKQCHGNATCSKEKKKRDYSIIENIKSLRQSFGKACNIMKEETKEPNTSYEKPNLMVLENIAFNSIKDNTNLQGDQTANEINTKTVVLQNINHNYEKMDETNYEYDEQINFILNTIEKEIHKHDAPDVILNKRVKLLCNDVNSTTIVEKSPNISTINNYKYNEHRKKTRNKEKSNFSVIDIIEEKANNDHEEVNFYSNNNTFADTVKCHIDRFLEKTQQSAKVAKKNIINLLEIKHNENFPQDNTDLNINDINILSNKKKITANNDVINTYIPPPQDNNVTECNQYKEQLELPQRELNRNCFSKLENSNGENSLITLNSTRKNVTNLLEEKRTEILCQENTELSNNNVDKLLNNKKIKLDSDVVNTITNHILNRENGDVLKSQYNNVTETSECKQQGLEVAHKKQNQKVEDKNCDGKIKNSNGDKFLITSDIKQNFILNSMKSYYTTCHLKSLFNFDLNLIKSSHPNDKRIKSMLKEIMYKMNIPLTNTSPESINFVASCHLATKLKTINKDDLSLGINEEENNKETYKVLSNYHTVFQTNVHNDTESTIAEASGYTKMYSFTKTHLNILSKSNLERDYCVINKLNIDVDVTNYKVLGDKSTLLVNKPLEVQNEIEYPSNESLTPIYDVSFDTLIEEPNIIQNAIQNDNYEEQSHIQEEQEVQEDNVRSQNEQNNNSVKDIILKYKNLISSKLNGNTQLDHQVLSSASSNTNLKRCEKILRPYKITDLPSLEQSNCLNSQTCSQPTHFKFEARKSHISKDNNIEINKYAYKPNELITHSEIVPSELDLKTSDTQLPISDIESPRLEQVEMSNDYFHMSQTMFNPKALLECLNQDDIIPPPSQFRDDNIFSPNRNFRTLDVESSQKSVEEKNTNILDNLNINVFEENQDTVLTPTKEKETWTLSRDNEIYRNPYKSFTIVRNNSTINLNPSQNSTRKTKLNEFKFSRKNIYTPRK